jgi:hypothetical protein
MQKYSYGSQRELFQYLIDPEHRLRINTTLLRESPTLRDFALDPGAIRWISPDLQTGKELKDSAWEKVGLREPSPQAAGWWPRSGPTWDAVARVRGRGGEVGAIFVEAKGRLPELRSTGCKATNEENRRKITSALYEVQAALGVARDPAWLGPVYQPANRLAWLWFAREHPAHGGQVPVWLLSVYFCGVAYDATRTIGPATEAEWRPAIDALHADMGLPSTPHELSRYWLELFLPSVVQSLSSRRRLPDVRKGEQAGFSSRRPSERSSHSLALGAEPDTPDTGGEPDNAR